MTADDLRPLLLSPADARAMPVHGRTEAAVLVPLHLVEGELHAVFTRRQGHLRRHAGEISFPGGRRDDADADLEATALREADEEIGLPADAVELVGALTPTPTFVTGYAVHPYVGLIERPDRWTPSDGEVAEILDLRLRDVRDGYELRRLVRRGLPFRTDTYAVGPDVIWGATARMVADLLGRLGPVL